MNIERLRNANVLITGGSSETGPFICRAFAEAGANVATTWHSHEAGAKENARHAFHLDLLSQESIDRLVAEVRKTFDRLDVLVLNCGSKGLRPFRQLSREQLDIAIDGNLKGNFMLAKTLGYWMKDRPADRPGRIILLSAMSAENTSHSAYGMGKAAQDAAAEFLAWNLAPEITVNTIAPITIDQDPASHQPPADPAPLGRQVHAREIARMAALMCDEAFDTVTGERLRMDAGRHVMPAVPREMK